jgi:autotransporter-associated beta strand protein
VNNNLNWDNGTNATTYLDGDAVTFNDTNNGSYAVTLNTSVTPASVTVNNSLGNYTISGSGSITGSGSLTKSGTRSLTLSTVNTYTGGTTVSGGTLVEAISGALPANSSVTVNGTGDLVLGSNTGVQLLSSLSVSGSGEFDININEVIISYGSSDPIATIAGYIASGYNNGHWTGPGIISSEAQQRYNGLYYGVGYADGADGVVAGLSSGQIEVKFTLYGDANLDGVVNGTDFSILASNFGQGDNGWDQGDFDYGGVVNGSDFALLAANFGQGDNVTAGVTAGDWAALDAFAAANGLLADVPEPTSAGLLTLSVIGMLSKRRRNCATSVPRIVGRDYVHPR